MRKTRVLGPAALAAMAAVVFARSTAQAGVEPGERITRKNVERIAEVAPPGVVWAVEHGMDIDVVPYQRIFPPRAYQEATERYSDQARVDDAGVLRDWVAGTPFPVVNDDDPKAAVKIMYNFERRFQFTDDVAVSNVDGETGSLIVGEDGTTRFRMERHFVADWSRTMNYAGRLYHEPMPAVEPNPLNVYRKFGSYPLSEPFDLKGFGQINYRYGERDRLDDTWFYIPIIRRVRRIATAERSNAIFGQDIDVDSLAGYAGQIAWFDWKLVGHKPMLATYHGRNLPGKPCEGNGGATFCEDWEMRPKVYILEGRPRMPGYAYSRRMIYVDKETWTIPYTDLYDHNGELWKTLQQNIRYSKRPNPNAELEYDDPQLFFYGITMLDTQLLHATRFSLPGVAFHDEPGWYVNMGQDGPVSVGEDWFTIARLVAAGR